MLDLVRRYPSAVELLSLWSGEVRRKERRVDIARRGRDAAPHGWAYRWIRSARNAFLALASPSAVPLDESNEACLGRLVPLAPSSPQLHALALQRPFTHPELTHVSHRCRLSPSAAPLRACTSGQTRLVAPPTRRPPTPAQHDEHAPEDMESTALTLAHSLVAPSTTSTLPPPPRHHGPPSSRSLPPPALAS